MKPTRGLVSMPGTRRSIAFAPGSRRSSGPGNAATVCGECDDVASPRPPPRSTSPPSPTISSAPDRSSWQPPDLANPETARHIKPSTSGLAATSERRLRLPARRSHNSGSRLLPPHAGPIDFRHWSRDVVNTPVLLYCLTAAVDGTEIIDDDVSTG